MQQGLNHWLVVAVNQQKGLSQARHPQFHVARFIERACQRWTRDQITLIANVGLSPYLESGQSVVMTDHGIEKDQPTSGDDLGLSLVRAFLPNLC